MGGHPPAEALEHVFASIQSLSRNGLTDLDPSHFDVVIVDEFHHAAAATYERLLTQVQPRELLGLTATPERADGLTVLDHFDGRIAAEMRLWDAIAEGRLAPFQYYAIHDGASLTEVPWKRGKGYDVEALSNVFTSDQAWARLVIRKTAEQADVTRMRAMGFCVSVAHARFMADQFTAAGIPSVAVWGDSPDDERRQALSDLRAGRIRAVFSVDLFNEGVDIPHVDTLLMLRPTESATLFLQQLGRGLRKSDYKEFCTVLDFVSQHKGSSDSTRRCGPWSVGARARISSATSSRASRICPRGPARAWTQSPRTSSWHPSATLCRPRGCSSSANSRRWCPLGTNHPAELLGAHGGRARGRVLIRPLLLGSPRRRRPARRALRAPGEAPAQGAGSVVAPRRLERIGFYRTLLAGEPPDRRPARRPIRAALAHAHRAGHRTGHSPRRQRSGRQPSCSGPIPRFGPSCARVLEVLAGRIDHEHVPLPGGDPCPLLVHARYSRIEIQAALGDGDLAKVPDWREGVRWLPDERTDALLVTLNKAKGNFSPTTAYRDYAMTRRLFHWESQSASEPRIPHRPAVPEPRQSRAPGS